jgi:hypothetical protein
MKALPSGGAFIYGRNLNVVLDFELKEVQHASLLLSPNPQLARIVAFV